MLRKNYNYEKKSSTYFILFILSVGLHKSDYLILQLTGISIQSTIGVSLLSFPLIFLVLSYYYRPARNINTGKNEDSLLMKIIFFYVNILLFYGLIVKNDVTIIFLEYWTGMIVLLSYKISKSENLWLLFESKLKVIFLIFSVLVFLGNGYTQVHLMEDGYDAFETGTTTALVSYNMAPILDFWPFVFLLSFFNKKIKYRILALVPLIIYLAFQLFFLKRAPSVRAISFLILAMIIKMKISGNSNAIIKQFFAFIVIGVLVSLAIPKALLDRFETKDSARQDEAKVMLTHLSPLEIIIGKGLGGTYYVEQGGIVQSINEEGRAISANMHIGAFYPILKGGLLLFFLIFYHILSTVFRNIKRVQKLSKEGLASLIFLIVYSVFRLIEGPISPGSIFDALLFGMSLGYLNRNKTNFKKITK
tara:strand:- start:12722 stop:13978 length:1257 start_codon:yes stop_codon:yes gene_type:complete